MPIVVHAAARFVTRTRNAPFFSARLFDCGPEAADKLAVAATRATRVSSCCLDAAHNCESSAKSAGIGIPGTVIRSCNRSRLRNGTPQPRHRREQPCSRPPRRRRGDRRRFSSSPSSAPGKMAEAMLRRCRTKIEGATPSVISTTWRLAVAKRVRRKMPCLEAGVTRRVRRGSGFVVLCTTPNCDAVFADEACGPKSAARITQYLGGRAGQHLERTWDCRKWHG